MPIIPPEVAHWLQGLSSAFHSTSWESAGYLLIGLLYGHARSSVVRAAQLAPDDYNWRRLHDFLRIGRWKGSELVAVLIAQILQTLYPEALPGRLWWVLDVTEKEKAFAEKIPGIKAHIGACAVVGRVRPVGAIAFWSWVCWHRSNRVGTR